MRHHYLTSTLQASALTTNPQFLVLSSTALNFSDWLCINYTKRKQRQRCQQLLIVMLVTRHSLQHSPFFSGQDVILQVLMFLQQFFSFGQVVRHLLFSQFLLYVDDEVLLQIAWLTVNDQSRCHQHFLIQIYDEAKLLHQASVVVNSRFDPHTIHCKQPRRLLT